MEFNNARYDDSAHKTFTLDVIKDNEVIPFTYLCNGEDDESSEVAAAVGQAFRAGQIEIEEHEGNDDEEKQKAKEERERRLAETDYFMLQDYPASEEDRTKVAAYRQSLRDITKQDGYPNKIIWPEKPTCLN